LPLSNLEKKSQRGGPSAGAGVLPLDVRRAHHIPYRGYGPLAQCVGSHGSQPRQTRHGIISIIYASNGPDQSDTSRIV
jgi:hypothetical protein